MKLIELTCNKCGEQLKVNGDLKKCMCQYCGNEMLIDNEIQHHKINSDEIFSVGDIIDDDRQKALDDEARKIKIRQMKYALKKAMEQDPSLCIQCNTNTQSNKEKEKDQERQAKSDKGVVVGVITLTCDKCGKLIKYKLIR